MNDWSEAEHHAQRGRRLYEAGQWDRALDELRIAVRSNPYQADWHFGMGLILDAMGRHREAAQAFEQALELRGEDAETLVHLGVDLLHSDQCMRAIAVLQRAGEMEPQCEATYCYRIAAHARLGQHDQAELMFYLARQVVDECPRCYDHLAESLAQRGQLERAIWCWQQTLRLQRTAMEIHRKLAAAHWQLGRHERARRELLAYLRFRPHNVETLMQLGRLLVEMERFADASERFRQVLAIEPGCAEAHHRLGELAVKIGHLDAAVDRLRRAEQLQPNRPGLNRLLAEIARQRGSIERCRALLLQESACRQDDPAQLLALARAMIEVDMPDAVVELLSPHLDAEAAFSPLHEPADRATALICRAVAHLVAGRLTPGIRDCRAGLRLVPNHEAALHNLVLANLEAGRWRRAAVWLRRARQQGVWHAGLRRLSWHVRRQRLLRWSRRVLGA